jgi:nitroimidazol reductase NimA-like FMN-containing flavoprotein (pyridoxamine 5'-phosphate oxidase superfamily)
MPSRRDAIRMTDEELRAYLAGHRRIILVTTGPNGMPHPVPMNYGADSAGRILMSSFRKSQKVRNLERDPRASLLVESGEHYQELKSVIAYCDAEIIDNPERVRSSMAIIRAGESLAETAGETVAAQVEASIAKRVILRFTPFRVISWDHAKLAGRY